MGAQALDSNHTKPLHMTRRQSLIALAGGIAGAVGPAVIGRAQPKGKGKVFIRTSGGSAEEGFRKAWYDPFTKETGIEVVSAVFDAAKVTAMVQTGNVAVDIGTFTAPQLTILARKGVIEKLDRSKFKLTNLNDIDRVDDYWLSKSVYATVIGYNTEAFPNRHPTSWKEFWDVKTFPGRRMLQDASSEYPDLEAALLADGVPMNKLYPLDVDRAFAKLKEIRKSIAKWWNSGAVSAQMLSDRAVIVGSIWESRITPLILAGAPLAIEWNQNMRNLYGMAVVKGAPNRDAAYLLMDYGQSPKVQAAIVQEVRIAPPNRKAYDYIDDKIARTLSTYPDHARRGFVNNSDWWVDNLERVAERWREFLLEG
ncbi:MAG: ABC transporter substrate-binding protein [Candidatus Rokubacteria bacterium]|nr:ABC transporter substrate-binding protein [Candidatus Rokubacteria bacterium]